MTGATTASAGLSDGSISYTLNFFPFFYRLLPNFFLVVIGQIKSSGQCKCLGNFRLIAVVMFLFFLQNYFFCNDTLHSRSPVCCDATVIICRCGHFRSELFQQAPHLRSTAHFRLVLFCIFERNCKRTLLHIKYIWWSSTSVCKPVSLRAYPSQGYVRIFVGCRTPTNIVCCCVTAMPRSESKEQECEFAREIFEANAAFQLTHSRSLF